MVDSHKFFLFVKKRGFGEKLKMVLLDLLSQNKFPSWHHFGENCYFKTYRNPFYKIGTVLKICIPEVKIS